MEQKKNLKAQVSMFVIFAIISIIIIVFLTFNNDFEFFESHDTKLKNQVSTVVKDCIEDSTRRGVFLLGFQGGYIEIPQSVLQNPFAYTDFGMKIPNWDTQKQNFPTIASMQIELNNFVTQESLSCINANIKSLDESFDIYPQGNFTTNSRINDYNVVVEANYLINFNEKNSEEKLSVQDYTVKLDNLRLGDLYNLAIEIYNTEKQKLLFEDLTLDQIGSANDYSSKYSVPTEGMTFSCARRIWTKDQLKKNIANLNNHNFKYLQFIGTYPKTQSYETAFNDELGTTSYKDYFENIYQFDLNNKKDSFQNYNVDVFMPSSEITGENSYIKRYPFRTFEVTPSSGQIVKSMNMEIDAGAKIPIPCIQVFHHLYTLDYDLIVKLTDYNEDGNNFVFQFPLRVEIYNNQAKTKPLSFIPETTKTLNNDNYCNEDSKLYPLMVNVKDPQNNAIGEVDISYKCINLKCDMGKTAIPTYTQSGLEGIEIHNADPELITEFPFCINGEVIAEKEGYHMTSQKVDTTSDLLRREAFVGDNVVEMEMIPTKTFKITSETFLIKIKETGQGLRILNENDGAIYVSLENNKYDFESTAILPNDEEYLHEIRFLDKEGVKYNMTIIYTDSDYELKGMLEVEDWEPEIHKGNNIQIVMPASSNSITEDSYINFYEEVKKDSEKIDEMVIFY